MRLDKFISQSAEMSRTDAKIMLRRGAVRVNAAITKSASAQITDKDVVLLNGEEISLRGPRYFMLHKPEDYVCAASDDEHMVVLNLLDESPKDLHIAGRLDIDTTGLVLITDDGKWSHIVTSPKHECSKRYHVWLADRLEGNEAELFNEGILLNNESKKTKPAQLEVINDREVRLTIVEGKYHQVKRMFAAIGNKVIMLHRESIGSVTLTDELGPGEYRALTEEEVNSFYKK
jgi:16S rRNA pseudouridine516 synthase